MTSSRLRNTLSLLVVAFLMFGIGGWPALATHEGTEPDTYTGCLFIKGRSKGKIVKVNEGDAPTAQCSATNQQQIHLSNGDGRVFDSGRVAVDDAEGGNETSAPLLAVGSITVVGYCLDELAGAAHSARVQINVGGGPASSISVIRSDGTAANETSTSGIPNAVQVASDGVPPADDDGVKSATFVVVSDDGSVLSGHISAELNELPAGNATDCTFAATAIGVSGD